MLNDSRAAFPNRIRAIVVDSDARFLRSACLMLSLLNFRVATCENPASAVKLLSGRLRDADVVFIDALRAAICGFDFRGIVEHDLFTPVIYFFSFDYKVAGDVAEALRRTVSAATYVIKKPLDADDLCRLWRIIQWSKVLLRRGENTLPWLEWPRGNQALPGTVEAVLPSSSTFEDQGEEEDNGCDLFEVVRAGRGRRRKLGESHDGGRGSSGSGRGRGGVAVRGRPTRRLTEKMNMTEGQESDEDDVVPSYQQPAQQNRRGVQAMDAQNQQNVPRNNPMISADAAGPSSSNATAFASASYISAATLLPAYQEPARARATSPAPHAVYSAQAPAPGLPPMHQQQQPVALYDFGIIIAPPAAAVPTMAATSGHQPPQFTPNQRQLQQDMFAPRRQGSWMGRRRETGPIMLSFRQPPAANPFTPMADDATIFGASPAGATDAGAYGDAAVAHLQSPSVGSQPADSFDDVLRAMTEMNDVFPRSYYANCSAEALLAPATDKLAAAQVALGSGNCSNYNAGSFMVTDVNGGNSASFMAPQDPAVPTGNQVELGAPGIYGSLGSPGPSAMFNGNGDMAAMFPSDQYDENAMLSLDALWNFDDDVPMHPGGQQVAAADSTIATSTKGIMSNGGEETGGLGPNWNMGAAHHGLDVLEEYLMDDNASDFLLPQDMNNGHQ